MVENLILLPEAERDLAEAYAWYEERRPGLGAELLESVEQKLLTVRQRPELFAFVHKQYRRALVQRFPYAIFYEHVEDSIVVYSIFHCAQDPEKWRRRLP